MTTRAVDAVMRPPRVRWSVDVALLAIGVVLAVWAAYVQRSTGASALMSLVNGAITLCYIGSGVVARHRPGRARLTIPMVLAGISWNLPDLLAAVGAPDGIVFASAFVFDVFLIVVLLTYPEGRVPTPIERWTIRGSIVVLVVFHVLIYPFHGTAAFDVLALVEGILQLALCVAVALIMLRRWRTASSAVRRALAPLWVAGLLTAISVAPQPILRPLTNLAVEGKLENEATTEAMRIFLVDIDVGAVVGLLVPLCFLVGLLRVSRSRTAVADLVVDLESAREPEPIRMAIAKALGDPTLRIFYWVTDETTDVGRYVMEDGAPAAMDALAGAQAITEVTGTGGPLATLAHDRELLAQPGLLRAVVAAARLALDNARLQTRLQAQLVQVRRSRMRLLQAGLEERRRVERDLHDGAQQRLLALGLTVSMIRDRLADIRPADAVLCGLAEDAGDEVKASITELRELARGIHPGVLATRGLGPAVVELTHRCPLPVAIDVPDRRWTSLIESTAYFVISEAIANVTKHAQASAAYVRVSESGGRLRLVIGDNGIGGVGPLEGSGGSGASFDLDATGTGGAAWADWPAGSGGLAGTADRAAALGGSLRVVSPPGAGTKIVVDLPCG